MILNRIPTQFYPLRSTLFYSLPLLSNPTHSYLLLPTSTYSHPLPSFPTPSNSLQLTPIHSKPLSLNHTHSNLFSSTSTHSYPLPLNLSIFKILKFIILFQYSFFLFYSLQTSLIKPHLHLLLFVLTSF